MQPIRYWFTDTVTFQLLCDQSSTFGIRHTTNLTGWKLDWPWAPPSSCGSMWVFTPLMSCDPNTLGSLNVMLLSKSPIQLDIYVIANYIREIPKTKKKYSRFQQHRENMMNLKLTSFVVNENGFVMNGNFTIDCPLLGNEDGEVGFYEGTFFFRWHRDRSSLDKLYKLSPTRLGKHKILISVWVNTLLEIVLSV